MGQGHEGIEGRGAMCYCPATPPFHVMAVLSGTRVVRILCVVVATPHCMAAYVCVGVAAECARLYLTAHGRPSTKRFMFLIMPNRRDCAKSANEFSIDLIMQ